MDLSSLWPPSRIPYQFIYKSYKAISHNSDGQLEKEYLSLIKDPYDRGIVSCVLGYSANNQFVFDACDKVVHVCPTAHPLLHSERRLYLYQAAI